MDWVLLKTDQFKGIHLIFKDDAMCEYSCTRKCLDKVAKVIGLD